MYGLTFVLKDSKILARPRNWITSRSTFALELFSCSYCVGLHTGWITFLLFRYESISLDSFSWVPEVLYYSFSGVTVSGLTEAILLRLER